ncbi:MAG: phage tail protein [Gallionellaceae bacterium]
MLTVKIEGLEELKRKLNDIGKKQVPFAAKTAINKVAAQTVRDVADEMKSKFDRPTRTTLKSMRVKEFADKRNLTAEVWLKDIPMGGNNPLSMAEMIGHQFSGGRRIHKNYERVLISKNYMKSDEFTVPAAGARINAYGNISQGQIVQILSQIGIKRAGSDSSPTNSPRSKRNVAKAGAMFWSYGVGSFPPRAFTGRVNKIDWETGKYRGKTQWLPKGVWARTPGGVIPVLLVIKAPTYSRRIVLEQITRKAMDRDFNKFFDVAFTEAMRTAR